MGSIFEHYHEQGTTVTAALYTEILKSKLKPALCNKHSGLLSRGVLLLHDNNFLILCQVPLKQLGS